MGPLVDPARVDQTIDWYLGLLAQLCRTRFSNNLHVICVSVWLPSQHNLYAQSDAVVEAARWLRKPNQASVKSRRSGAHDTLLGTHYYRLLPDR